MIGLDTNVLVRYIMQDDVQQARRATRLIDSFTPEEPGFVPLVAMLELVWVLESSYRLGRAQVALALEALLCSKELVIHEAQWVSQALSSFKRDKADFSDALLQRMAQSAGCNMTMTFDAGAAKLAGMTLVP